MIRLYSSSRFLPDEPHELAFLLNAHDNSLQLMPLEYGLEPAPAGRLRRVVSSITLAASHAVQLASCLSQCIAAAHATTLKIAGYDYVRVWAWIQLSASKMASFGQIFDSSLGMDEFIGEWTVKVLVDSQEIGKINVDVLC